MPEHPPGIPAWTLEEASAYFADGGVPIEIERLRLIIRELRKASGGRTWAPVGESAPGDKGGRGKPLYPVADLMRLHAAIAPWIAVQGPRSGYNPETGGRT